MVNASMDNANVILDSVGRLVMLSFARTIAHQKEHAKKESVNATQAQKVTTVLSQLSSQIATKMEF